MVREIVDGLSQGEDIWKPCERHSREDKQQISGVYTWHICDFEGAN
jgi:hypothetical protein